MARLDGQVALVTGAAGGIGRVICARYLDEGAQVLALDLNGDGAAKAVGDAPDRALALACDVTDAGAVQAAIAAGVARFGKLTVLTIAAGGSTPADGPVTDVPDAEFWRAVTLDLYGTFLICKHGIPELIRAGGGSVVTMGSITALIGTGGLAAYSAAKGGIGALTRTIAKDYAAKGVRANAIAPGITMTERIRKGFETGHVSGPLADRHLLGIVAPEAIAEMAVVLADPASGAITGQVIPVDSGASAT